MKFFKNPKVKFLTVLAGVSLIITILGAGLGVGLTTISYELEKYFGWKLWQNTEEMVASVISISMVAGLFAAVSLGAVVLYGLSEWLKALSKKLHKKLTRF